MATSLIAAPAVYTGPIHTGRGATVFTHIANFDSNATAVVRGELPHDWWVAQQAAPATVFTTMKHTSTPLSTVHPAVRIML